MNNKLLVGLAFITGLASGLISYSNSAFATDIQAKHVSGYDKLSDTKATDCTYIVEPDRLDSTLLIVGVNSISAPYNNVLVRIPKDLVPLANGFSSQERYSISYIDGVLKAKRKKTGEGSINEDISMRLEVSPDLKSIVSAKVQKKDGFLVKSVLAQMECIF